MSDVGLMQKIRWNEATNKDVAEFFGIEQKFGYLAGKRSPVKYYHDFPDWLGSVDAALSLVPDTFDYYIERSSPSGNWRFSKHIKNGDFEMLSGVSKSPAVSIVKAMIVLKKLQDVEIAKAKIGYTVYCSSCGSEFKHKEKTGFSHCEDHEGILNHD